MIVCGTDVGGAWVSVIAVSVLVAARGVLNRNALANGATAPDEASSRTVWVWSARLDQRLRRVSRLAACLFLSLDTLLVEASIQGAWHAVITIGCLIAAASDRLVMALIASGACVGGADVIVFAVLVGEAAVIEVDGEAITTRYIADLASAGVTVAGAVTVYLTAAG